MMERLYALLAEPVTLPWIQLRKCLPKFIELPAPQGDGDEGDDSDELFKRIDLITRSELAQHLQVRQAELLQDLQTLQLLGELHRRSVAAGCGADAPVLAAMTAVETGQVQP